MMFLHSRYRSHATIPLVLLEDHFLLPNTDRIMKSFFQSRHSQLLNIIIIPPPNSFIILFIKNNSYFNQVILINSFTLSLSFTHEQHTTLIHISTAKCADQTNDNMKRQHNIKWGAKNVQAQKEGQSRNAKGKCV